MMKNENEVIQRDVAARAARNSKRLGGKSLFKKIETEEDVVVLQEGSVDLNKSSNSNNGKNEEVVVEDESISSLIDKLGFAEPDLTKERTQFTSHMYLLTYPSFLNKIAAKATLRGFGATKVYVSHERGMKLGKPYEHTHIVADWGKTFRVTSCRKFDMEGKHPNIKMVKKNKTAGNPWQQTVRYICKDDMETRAEVILAEGADFFDKVHKSIVEDILACSNQKEAMLKFVQIDDSGKISNTAAIRDIFACKDDVNIDRPGGSTLTWEKLWDWQRQLINIIRVDPMTMDLETKYAQHMRRVIWIYDPSGKAGKSSCIRFFNEEFPKWAVQLPNITDTKSIACQLLDDIKNGTWNGKVCITDLTRRVSEYNICGTIEQIKNGVMNSTKYKPGTISFCSPHVVIFSNSLPTKEQIDGFTRDRWDIRQIGAGMRLHKLKQREMGDSWMPIELEEKIIPRTVKAMEYFDEGEDDCLNHSEEYYAKVNAFAVIEGKSVKQMIKDEPRQVVVDSQYGKMAREILEKNEMIERMAERMAEMEAEYAAMRIETDRLKARLAPRI